MQGIKKINRKITAIIVSIILLVVAGILLGAATYVKLDDDMSQGWIKTEATIIEDSAYGEYFKIRYTFSGEVFEVEEHQYYTSTKTVGSTLAIRVNPSDPYKLYFEGEKDVFIPFLICGICCLLGAISYVVFAIVRTKQIEALKRDGQKHVLPVDGYVATNTFIFTHQYYYISVTYNGIKYKSDSFTGTFDKLGMTNYVVTLVERDGKGIVLLDTLKPKSEETDPFEL